MRQRAGPVVFWVGPGQHDKVLPDVVDSKKQQRPAQRCPVRVANSRWAYKAALIQETLNVPLDMALSKPVPIFWFAPRPSYPRYTSHC